MYLFLCIFQLSPLPLSESEFLNALTMFSLLSFWCKGINIFKVLPFATYLIDTFLKVMRKGFLLSKEEYVQFHFFGKLMPTQVFMPERKV